MLNKKIIKTALLGLKTSKVQIEIFPQKVQGYLDGIQNDEDIFLNGLSMSFQYLESGKELPVIEQLSSQVEICPLESLPHANEQLIRAFDLVTKNEFIKFSFHSFVKLIVQKVVAQKVILPSDRLVYVVDAIIMERMNFARTEHLDISFKILSKRNLFHSYQSLEKVIIESFGNTGKWIFDMMAKEETIDIEDLDAKSRKLIFKRFWYYEKEQILPFLNSFFKHETPTNQKYFLKIMSQSLTSNDNDIYAFFETFLDENTGSGKRWLDLERNIEMLKIVSDDGHSEREELESIFQDIWNKSLLSGILNLKPKKELVSTLMSLDEYAIENYVDALGLEDLDLKLFFLIQLIPIERAAQLLKVTPEKYVATLAKVRSFEGNKYFTPINALIRNVFKTGDKVMAKQILKQVRKTKNLRLDLLLLFTDEEIYKFLEDNFDLLDYSSLDIFEVLVVELNCKKPWSENLTRLMINRILTNQHFYSHGERFYKTLWLGGPFYHRNIQQIVNQLATSKEHEKAWKRHEIQTYIRHVII